MRLKKGIFAVLFVLVFLIGLILAAAPDWINGASDTNYTIAEDSTYYHNFSANITGFNNDVTFDIDTQGTIYWTNATGRYSVSEASLSDWIAITNSSTGNLTINATYDNQTGFFEIPIQATNSTGQPAAITETFEFIINATNDFPNFTNINTTYNFSAIAPLLHFLNASDEEQHYPLNFTLTFNATSCTHASWSGMNDDENCSLYDFGFNITNTSNTSALLNFTPNSTYVGVYYANISVRDWGENYSCPHDYCVAGYSQNKTTYYSQTVAFNVLGALEVNTSNCDSKVFQEGQEGTCNITILTKGDTDSLNISSYAILRNYAAGQSGVNNTSWFAANRSVTSSNFAYNVTINVTPGKTEIGNWTINFTVNDTSYNETSTSQIYVYVNRTNNDVPDLLAISNVNTSINLETVINLTVHDDDLLVPDKNSSYGGFNETTTLSRTILNQSNLAQELTLSNFSITVLTMPTSGTNKTTAEIRFTANSSDIGNYTINVSVNDSENALDYYLFNLSILNNSAPEWDNVLEYSYTLTEDVAFYLNLSENSTDTDGDTLTYSYSSNNSFPSFVFNTSTGEINITANDSSVGLHLVNITVSDGYLTDILNLTFLVNNVNDVPLIHSMATTNATPTSGITNNSEINASEDNYTTFSLFVEDDDFRIPSGQKTYYNETITFNLTIAGPNTNFFNFTSVGIVGGFPNRTQFNAIFTPNKTDVGDYNITINITDNSSVSRHWNLNLTVLETQHNPALSSLSNQSSAENRTFYYDVNVTDTEDGNDTSDTNPNFTFSYTNLSGNNIFSSYFNNTTGIFNITLNSSHPGSYRLNVTVNDSGNLTDYEAFWIFVYGLPNVSFPSSGAVINLTENNTSIVNFTVNHTVGDNLTYLLYIDGIECAYQNSSNCNYTSSVLRDTENYYGNGSSLNWSFTPNFTDETYGNLKNLTLMVFPNSSSLVNASNVSTNISFKLNISHANAPLSFSGDIADQGPITVGNVLDLDLTDYFSDIDYDDAYYAQSTTWTVSSNATTSAISSSVPASWAATFSATTATLEQVNITASDSSSNASSNNFLIEFVAATSSQTASSSGGGGTTEVPVSLKLLLPDPVSAFQDDKIELPITLSNTGETILRGIHLSASVAKNGSVVDDVKISFTKKDFVSLAEGESTNTTMTVEINTQEVGLYEITVVGDVDNPSYTDWGKIYLTIKEGVDVEERILFTEEFIVSNPECLELVEMIDDAKIFSAQGKATEALAKAEEALNACKNSISQASRARLGDVVENNLYRYLIIATVIALLVGIGFYSYKRMRLKRRQQAFIQQDIKNRKFLDYS